jgi:hypothetical protein
MCVQNAVKTFLCWYFIGGKPLNLKNNMNHLQTIRDRVIAAVPEIAQFDVPEYLSSPIRYDDHGQYFWGPKDEMASYASRMGSHFNTKKILTMEQDSRYPSLYRQIIVNLGRPIRLADVLVTLNQKWMVTATDHAIAMQGDGIRTFLWRQSNDTQIRQFLMLWNLLIDDLNLQSPETIEFLYNLLK